MRENPSRDRGKSLYIKCLDAQGPYWGSSQRSPDLLAAMTATFQISSRFRPLLV